MLVIFKPNWDILFFISRMLYFIWDSRRKIRYFSRLPLRIRSSFWDYLDSHVVLPFSSKSLWYSFWASYGFINTFCYAQSGNGERSQTVIEIESNIIRLKILFFIHNKPMFKFCKENDEFETMNFVQAGLALTLLFVHLAVLLRYKKVSKVWK